MLKYHNIIKDDKLVGVLVEELKYEYLPPSAPLVVGYLGGSAVNPDIQSQVALELLFTVPKGKWYCLYGPIGDRHASVL